MRIISFADGECKESKYITTAFSMEHSRNPIISFVGAGGKTTLIKTLAKEYKRAGRKAFITTTTHMYQPKDTPIVTRFAPQRISGLLDTEQIVWAGRDDGNGKLTVPTEKLMQSMYTYRIPILIEADGSKGLPCKTPAEHEPVICSQTSIVVGVLGMDAIGQPITKVCHRPDRVAKLLQKEADDKLTWKDMVILASSYEGLKKNVAPHMRYIVFFNKMDERRQKRTSALMAKALADMGQKEIFFGVMDEHENTD